MLAERYALPDYIAIHAQALVLDAHADIEIPGKESRYVGTDGLSKVAPDKMKAGGVDAVVMAVAVGPGPRDADGYAAARAMADEKLAAVAGSSLAIRTVRGHGYLLMTPGADDA